MKSYKQNIYRKLGGNFGKKENNKLNQFSAVFFFVEIHMNLGRLLFNVGESMLTSLPGEAERFR